MSDRLGEIGHDRVAREVEGAGRTSILFRIYKPVQDHGEHQQRHQPLSVRESSCAALPLAVLALSTPTLLLQIATISLSLYRSHFPLQHLVTMLHGPTASFLPFLFSSAYIGCLQKCEYCIGATFFCKEIGNSELIASALCLYSDLLPKRILLSAPGSANLEQMFPRLCGPLLCWNIGIDRDKDSKLIG